MSPKILKYGLPVFLFALLILGTSGCQHDSPPPSLSNPFTNSMSYWTLEGYTSGYTAGEKYNFGLTLKNTDEEVWQSKYSVYLIDTKGVVLNIVSQRPFTIQPESSISSDIEMILPKDIQNGTYGLMLVFPGRGTSITTIYIGQVNPPAGKPARVEDGSKPSGPWPDPSELPQL